MLASSQGFLKKKANSRINFQPNILDENRVYKCIQEFVTVGDNGLHELIHDKLNPFIAGRACNMTFVKDLFEILKPTLVIKLTKKGMVGRNMENCAFDFFNGEFNNFIKIHLTCGPHCKHLMKFYHKIGFFRTLKLYNNKSSVQLPILDFEKNHGMMVISEKSSNPQSARVPTLPSNLKKNQDPIDQRYNF